MNRWWEIDALRGLMLVLMTLTHLPTRFSQPFGQPFGFVSAAEGFVFLSGFMAGLVFTRRAHKDGVPAMRRSFLQRALKIYGCHVALLLLLFTLITAIGITTQQEAIKNLVSFYLDKPFTALLTSLLLLYNPPLLDILPLYVVFMLLSPWVLMSAFRFNWTVMLTLSAALWLGAQFGLEKELYQAIRAFSGIQGVPFSETGAFDVLAWQLLWFFGLALGSITAGRPLSAAALPGVLPAAALFIAATCLVWRHAAGAAPFGSDTTLNALFGKWHLGPLRVVNFFALALVVAHFGPLLGTRLRFRALEMLGAASLPVFCAHLVVVLLALAAMGDRRTSMPPWFDLALLASTFALLYATAWYFRAERKRSAPADAPPAGRDTISAGAAR